MRVTARGWAVMALLWLVATILLGLLSGGSHVPSDCP